VDIPAIRTTIELAKRHESSTGHLRDSLTQQLPKLHTAIQLPRPEPVAVLLEFIIAYIEHVPNCLEAAAAITREAQIESQTWPLLQLAQDYFLKPSELTDSRIGLGELLDEAYLAHRLLEEINDHYRLEAGIPLLPVDMTVANLIGHHLIGEPFANELDEAVHFSVEQLLHRHPPTNGSAFEEFVLAHRDHGWEKERLRWPCLTRQLDADLQLVGF
jgi:hypothetical protein